MEVCWVSAYPDLASRDISYIEVFRCGVSKAAAVLKLKSILGADRLTVYGDHLNDLPMFAVADESVAVSNALPEVLSAASRIIGPNTLPSVAMDMKPWRHRNGTPRYMICRGLPGQGRRILIAAGRCLILPPKFLCAVCLRCRA